MNRSLLVSALALGLFVTGCSASTETTALSAQDIEEAPKAAGVTQTVDTTAGAVLANAAGRSLYTFDADTTTSSTCYDACAAHWPALLLPDGASVVAPFATTTRNDGTTQVTLDGHPLYTFAGDAAQGDVHGDGLGGVWHLARPAAPTTTTVVVTQVVDSTAGRILANEAGLSLYTFDNDTTTDSTCSDGCAAHWPALLLPSGAAVSAPFGTTTRTDGNTQVTRDGHPLYTFAGDAAQGDVHGDGLGGVWHLAHAADN